MYVRAAALLVLSVTICCGGAASTREEPEVRPVASGEHGGESEAPVAESTADETPAMDRVSKSELARRVFEAVQAHDFESYRQYAPRPEDLIAALPNLTDERAGALHAEMMAQQQMMFEEAIARGEHEGIVWVDAIFREAQQNGSERRPNIFIVFEHGGEPYSMKMDDCIETERGWVVGDYLATPQHGESRRDPVD